MHQATQLRLLLYALALNGVYLDNVTAERLVAVMNHRVHGSAGFLGQRGLIAGRYTAALLLGELLAASVVGYKQPSALAPEKFIAVFAILAPNLPKINELKRFSSAHN